MHACMYIILCGSVQSCVKLQLAMWSYVSHKDLTSTIMTLSLSEQCFFLENSRKMEILYFEGGGGGGGGQSELGV